MSSDGKSAFVANKEDPMRKITDLTTSSAEDDLINLTIERQNITIDLTIEEPKTIESIPDLFSEEQVQHETIQAHQQQASKLPSLFAPVSSKQKRKTDCPSGNINMAKKAKFMTLKEYKECASIDKSENARYDIHRDTLEGILLIFFANYYLFSYIFIICHVIHTGCIKKNFKNLKICCLENT